ncbi:MAG: hypothetical protein A2Y18_04045 [Clostridiales bacterium GWD2_32_19]|nr:MAG: hypothetical protein A2Y18_04045 [Clostridiales bacterium GWD2_32_19]
MATLKNNIDKLKEQLVSYESINLNRVKGLVEDYIDNKTRVSRAEIILTDKCNLQCCYCKKRKRIDEYEDALPKEALLDSIRKWSEHGCKFIHVTGGEVTTVSYLNEIIELCGSLEIKVSISTNATASIELYKELIQKGLKSVHISLDTSDSKQLDQMVGVEGSFNKVIDTINCITDMRDNENYDINLTFNTCVTPTTISTLPQILKFLLDLKPNDIKLIPISQLKNEWPRYKEEYFNNIYPLVKDMVPEKGFNMLKSRLEILVKPQFRGYNDLGISSECFLMGAERTIDPKGNYYGCYINYREGGKIIGNILEDSFEEQTRKIKLEAKNLSQNNICKQYCADITVLCNLLVGEMIEDKVHS